MADAGEFAFDFDGRGRAHDGCAPDVGRLPVKHEMVDGPLRAGVVIPGDIIVFLGRPHLVARVDPHPTYVGWEIARADDGWGISLEGPGLLTRRDADLTEVGSTY